MFFQTSLWRFKGDLIVCFSRYHLSLCFATYDDEKTEQKNQTRLVKLGDLLRLQLGNLNSKDYYT